MADVDVFVSVHGAAMTNMFFMRPGSAVVELLPYPLCHCRSPDYFYGVGGYYHSRYGTLTYLGIYTFHYAYITANTFRCIYSSLYTFDTYTSLHTYYYTGYGNYITLALMYKSVSVVDAPILLTGCLCINI